MNDLPPNGWRRSDDGRWLPPDDGKEYGVPLHPPQIPPAGWYLDPGGSPGLLRYWDGSIWREEFHDSRTLLTGDSLVPLPVPRTQSGSPGRTYRSDLKWSANTLRASPYFVLVSVGLVAIFDLSSRGVIRPRAVSGLLSLVVEVFLIGFVGAQRVWFLRKLQGTRFEAREVWTVPWRFFGRFLCLSLLGTLLVIPVVVPLAIATAHDHTAATRNVPVSHWVTVGVVIGAFLVDVALTFVVPALALNVRSVKTSIRLGWNVTKSTWPTNAWYMFTPGATLVAIAAVLPNSVASSGVYLVVGVISALLNLWFKGAIVAFYVRSVSPASTDGSAYL
jgi:hypothetical protein